MEKKRILIADDDIDFITQLECYLTSRGYDTISARDEKTAMKLIQDEKFDLAILDLMMDNQDTGFILGYRIKKKSQDIPVILVTAVTKETGYRFNLNNENNQAWIKADAVLNKNIRYEQLQKEINRLLSTE